MEIYTKLFAPTDWWIQFDFLLPCHFWRNKNPFPRNGNPETVQKVLGLDANSLLYMHAIAKNNLACPLSLQTGTDLTLIPGAVQP